MHPAAAETEADVEVEVLETLGKMGVSQHGLLGEGSPTKIDNTEKNNRVPTYSNSSQIWRT